MNKGPSPQKKPPTIERKKYTIDQIIFLSWDVTVCATPMLPINTIGNKTKRSIQTTIDNTRSLRAMTICAPRYHQPMARIHIGKEILRNIFFSFRNLAIAPIALHKPENLLVAIATCGGNPKSIKAGMLINPAHPEMAEIIQMITPNTAIDIRKSILYEAVIKIIHDSF